MFTGLHAALLGRRHGPLQPCTGLCRGSDGCRGQGSNYHREAVRWFVILLLWFFNRGRHLLNLGEGRFAWVSNRHLGFSIICNAHSSSSRQVQDTFHLVHTWMKSNSSEKEDTKCKVSIGSLTALGKVLEEGQISKGKVIYLFYPLNLWCLQTKLGFSVWCWLLCYFQIKISAYYSPKIKINHSSDNVNLSHNFRLFLLKLPLTDIVWYQIYHYILHGHKK